MPTQATGILLDMLEAYYRLKDGLVADDELAVQTGTAQFGFAVGRLDTFILTSSSGYYHLWEVRDTLKKTVAAMARLKDETFAQRRLHFRTISVALFDVLKKTALRGTTVYRFYDAAAFNDSGAYWLSYSPEIRNPYFGRKMPQWGEVVDTLR